MNKIIKFNIVIIVIISNFVCPAYSQKNYHFEFSEEDLQLELMRSSGAAAYTGSVSYVVTNLTDDETLTFNGKYIDSLSFVASISNATGYSRQEIENIELIHNSRVWETLSESYGSTSFIDGRIIRGPGEVVIRMYFRFSASSYNVASLPDSIIATLSYARRYSYSIDGNDDEDSKFSVSLDNDGDRVAVGYKSDGSNAVVRVYEFNGSDWQQLGNDID